MYGADGQTLYKLRAQLAYSGKSKVRYRPHTSGPIFISNLYIPGGQGRACSLHVTSYAHFCYFFCYCFALSFFSSSLCFFSCCHLSSRSTCSYTANVTAACGAD